MPRPTDVPTWRSFLGDAIFYGKFIREIHQLRRSLNNLLRKDTEFAWSEECQHAFSSIKSVLQSNLILTHYDRSLEIIVAGDASKTGIGTFIMNRFSDGQIKPVAHAPTLTKTEQNYGPVEMKRLH